MKVSELLEILQDHDPNDYVKIATSPARPYASHVRGVVKPTGGSPVFILEDYDAQPITLDLWRLLDE